MGLRKTIFFYNSSSTLLISEMKGKRSQLAFVLLLLLFRKIRNEIIDDEKEDHYAKDN